MAALSPQTSSAPSAVPPPPPHATRSGLSGLHSPFPPLSLMGPCRNPLPRRERVLCGNESPGKRDPLHWRSALALVPMAYRAGGRRSRGGGGCPQRGGDVSAVSPRRAVCPPPTGGAAAAAARVPPWAPPPTTQNEGGLQGYLRVLAQAPGPPRPKACSRYQRRLAARSLGGDGRALARWGAPEGGYGFAFV